MVRPHNFLAYKCLKFISQVRLNCGGRLWNKRKGREHRDSGAVQERGLWHGNRSYFECYQLLDMLLNLKYAHSCSLQCPGGYKHICSGEMIGECIENYGARSGLGKA